MNDPALMTDPPDQEMLDWLALSAPDVGERENLLILAALRAQEWSSGGLVTAFENRFAAAVHRRHAIAVSSGTAGLMATLGAYGWGAGGEVIMPAHGWRHIGHAVTLCGLTPVFADIDYWCGCIAPARVADRITPQTRAILGNNANGHPAEWDALRALATAHGVALIEDSSEAIGSVYHARLVGSFGDVAIFDFAEPSPLCVGEGGMVVTDDDTLAAEIRYRRQRVRKERMSLSVGSRVPLQCGISELTAALGLAQLERLDDILARRKRVEAFYHEEMQSFEGIKPPYVAEGVDAVHWMLYVVHLGKRFAMSARNQIVDDLDANAIEAAPYSVPLVHDFHYQQLGWKRGALSNTDRISDRALALPFHGELSADEVRFIVATLKDACTNVGAGAAIYL